MSSDRRGAGILLVLVAVVLLCLLLAGLSRLTFGSRVQRDGAATAEGERARMAVRSALDEAAFRFGTALGQADSPIREAVLQARRFDGELPVPLAGGAVGFTYEPGGTDDLPYVRGRVTLRASSAEGGRGGRSGTMVREVVTAQVTPLSPFDQCALLILEPFDELADTRLANAALEDGHRRWKRLSEERREIEALLGRFGIPIRAEPLPVHPEYVHDVQSRHHYLDPASVVASFEGVPELASLAVTGEQAQALTAEVERTAALQRDARDALEREVRDARPPADPLEARRTLERWTQLLDRYHRASLGAARALLARSERYTRLTDALVEYTGRTARDVREAAARLFELQAWKGRASYSLPDGGRLLAFLQRYHSRNEGLRGVAWVEDREHPLSLDGLALSGRLALASAGAVTARGQTVAGSLTIVCDSFQLDGSTQASVVCKRFRGAPGGSLRGQLIVEQLGSGADLAGRLEAVPPPSGDGIEIVLSPWPIEGGIKRDR